MTQLVMLGRWSIDGVPGGVRGDQIDEFLSVRGLEVDEDERERCIETTTEPDIVETEGGRYVPTATVSP